MIDAQKVRASRGLTELSACKLLHKLASRVPKDRVIVELGAYKGRTTGWLALGAEHGHGAQVFSVDPWDLRPEDDRPDYSETTERGYTNGGYRGAFAEFAAHLAATHAKSRVTPLRDFAARAGETWLGGARVGLLFHDAQHTYEAVRDDLTAWAPHMAAGSYVVLHDACNPMFGVIDGAAEVLTEPEWAWDARRVKRWKKRADRRGILIVRKR